MGGLGFRWLCYRGCSKDVTRLLDSNEQNLLDTSLVLYEIL